jgi:hypothetical protein
MKANKRRQVNFDISNIFRLKEEDVISGWLTGKDSIPSTVYPVFKAGKQARLTDGHT